MNIVPVKITGYHEISEFFNNTHKREDVRAELDKIESPIIALNVLILKQSEKTNDMYEIIGKISEFIQQCSTPFIEYEEFAITYFAYQAGNKEYKQELTRELIKRKDASKKIAFDEKSRIIYDSSKVYLEFIGSVGDYTSRLQELIEGSDEVIFYRGHRKVNYRMLPALFRDREYYENENKMYQTLLTDCPQDFMGLNGHLDILAHMQHYRLPTRLLDITSNALTALYFACEDEKDDLGEVIILGARENQVIYAQHPLSILMSSLPLLTYNQLQRIEGLLRIHGDLSSDPDGLELLSETNTEKEISNIKRYVNDLTQYAVVLPRKLNKRIINQDGAFIICGLFEDVYRGVVKRKGVDEKPAISNLEDLRKKNKNGKRPVFLIKNKKKIISQLHTFGIEKTKIYPEIDDVAEYIQKHVNEI